MSPVLSIAGLTIALPKGSDRDFALKDFSLTVEPGEIVSLHFMDRVGAERVVNVRMP